MQISREYSRAEQDELLADFPVEWQAVAEFLGEDLKELTFDKATSFRHPNRDRSVQLEFAGRSGRTVWVRVKGTSVLKILDG
ncbi:MAG TPA: hypothetical protein VL475_04875 [Planctomycetaceae bacterium]|nr:hypothetical protein [Planctomycetaceae bacterium]